MFILFPLKVCVCKYSLGVDAADLAPLSMFGKILLKTSRLCYILNIYFMTIKKPTISLKCVFVKSLTICRHPNTIYMKCSGSFYMLTSVLHYQPIMFFTNRSGVLNFFSILGCFECILTMIYSFCSRDYHRHQFVVVLRFKNLLIVCLHRRLKLKFNCS